MTFKDHFSAHSTDYARYRPHYPRALFSYLASISPARDFAWDCATGNGQAALGLAEFFQKVVATDASEAQLSQATEHQVVEYRRATAEDSGLGDKTVDIVTVAQALHWLDPERFFVEVERVLKPGGVLAAWCYNLIKVSPEIDPELERFYSETVGPFWPPERVLVETGFRTIEFPFNEVEAPTFELTANWSLSETLGYMRTWSATQRFIAEHGHDPVEDLREVLLPAWGGIAEKRRIIWPLSLVVRKA
jgi:SAM-dependent methyltransferase